MWLMETRMDGFYLLRRSVSDSPNEQEKPVLSTCLVTFSLESLNFTKMLAIKPSLSQGYVVLRDSSGVLSEVTCSGTTVPATLQRPSRLHLPLPSSHLTTDEDS